MTELPDLSQLTHEEKDALIRALWGQVQALTTQVRTLVARVAELEAKLDVPPKTPDNSSLPPSRGQKPNRAAKAPQRGGVSPNPRKFRQAKSSPAAIAFRSMTCAMPRKVYVAVELAPAVDRIG